MSARHGGGCSSDRALRRRGEAYDPASAGCRGLITSAEPCEISRRVAPAPRRRRSIQSLHRGAGSPAWGPGTRVAQTLVHRIARAARSVHFVVAHTVHPNGDIFFSDPAYGRIPVYGRDRPAQLGFQGVFCIRIAKRELDLVASDCEQPNGLCFSPDAGRFYVDDCERGTIWVYDVSDAAHLSHGRLLREDVGVPFPFEAARTNRLPSGLVDGMKCDELGNVYVTEPGGIVVLTFEGCDLGIIGLAEDVANFAWGGPDGLDLFICCRSFLGRVRMKVHGAAITGAGA